MEKCRMETIHITYNNKRILGIGLFILISMEDYKFTPTLIHAWVSLSFYPWHL